MGPGRQGSECVSSGFGGVEEPPQTHARWIGGRLGSPKLVRGWALGWEWLGAWISGSQAPKRLMFWVWRRLGQETEERGSPAPQKEGSWDFTEFWERNGGRGWRGCGFLQTRSHGSPGSRLQGVRSLEWSHGRGRAMRACVPTWGERTGGLVVRVPVG